MASDAPAVPVPVPAPIAATAPPPKRRGSYNCGRCGLPKKGHVCSIPGPAAASAAAPDGGGNKAGEPQLPMPPPPQQQQQAKPRRALQFDGPVASAASPPAPPSTPAAASFVVRDAVPLAVAPPSRRPPPHPPVRRGKAAAVDVDSEEEDGGDDDEDEDDDLPWVELGAAGRRCPGEVLVEVLRRLPPRALAAAAGASRGWRHCANRIWKDAETVTLNAAGFDSVAALLKRCTTLSRLELRIKRDAPVTMLGCIAFCCPNLQSLDISMANNTANRITGDDLSRFVKGKRSLSVLKLGGCSSLGFLNISSSSLSTLWMSGLCSLTKAVMNCPNLNELSLVFPEKNNDSTNLIALMDSLGRTCPNLRNMHVSSTRLCDKVVLALESANLRGLRMLSLLLGSKIKDEAVTYIVRSYASLELLDLSGSGITDNGLKMISNAFPNTLTHLSLALCPNITSFGIGEAVEQLPLLRLMDCGNSICDKPQLEAGRTYFGELIINHNNLKKLSLWGCSAINALYVKCPELVDLNLNSCTNIHPERLRITCRKLKDVHANGCPEMLIGAIRNQVLNEFDALEPRLPRKRLADGSISKRVHVPQYMIDQLENCGRPRKSQCTVHR